MENTKTLKECLTLLAISHEELENLSLQSQFSLIKENYHDLIRQTHPDKNPTLDGSRFREVRACFNVLKKKYSENKESQDFTFAIFFDNGAVAEDFEGYLNGNIPSWDFYEAAEAVEMPRYCVEAAKSGRSKCKKCKENIEKGDIRIGGLMEEYGNYSRWNHLNCWRIPERLWSAFSDENNADTVLSELLEMDELVLKGLNVLEHSDQVNIVECVRDSTKWASYSKKKQKDREARLNSLREAMEADDSKPAAVCEPDENEDDRKPAAKQDNETESTMNVDESAAKRSITETNTVSSQDSTNNETHTFEIPIPGKNGCLVDKLKDKVFVISGSFGDLGNGKGRGTTKARAVVESFGGTVRKAISGNTDYLLLGSRANCKIVAKGKEMSNVTLISAISLQKLLLNKINFESLSLEGITEYDSNQYDKENKRPVGDNDEVAKKPSAKRQKTDALVEATSASEKKQKFEVPVPGREGAVPNALDGKIFVITGVFPELGGGAGLTLGKNKCTTMIENFGGVVRSAISGKTNYLVVGKEPGPSKYNQAKTKGLPMLDLRELRRLMMGETTLEAIDENPPQLQIQKFCDIASRKRIGEW